MTHQTDHGESHQPDSSAFEPDIVIEAGTLMTMVEGAEPVGEAAVWIKGDRILDIQHGLSKDPYPGSPEIINARDAIVMPGLINGHCHASMTLFRGFADDLPLKTWLFDRIFPAEAQFLSPDTVYWGALLGCLEMMASGTTTFLDGYFFQDETVKAVHRSGLRALVAQGVVDFPAPGVSDPRDNLRIGEAFLQRWLHFSDLIMPGLFCHSALTCSKRTLQGAMEISQVYSLPLQIHLSETMEEVNEIIGSTGHRPVHYLDSLGLLNERLVAAHAIHLNDQEIATLSRRFVKVVHVPESNMKLTSGVARISEMLAKGLTVGLGTDGCASNNNLDLFQEMDIAAKLDKVFTLNPVSLDARTALKMATSWGAKVLGLEEEIGTLEKGKKADIIVVDIQAPHMVPLYNPISNLVYSANGADVKHVIVNGKMLMKDRGFLTLDAQEIMDKVRAISQSIRI
jgi:5-methylthioadenosine/S-adenosylhomocysteine deaminase